jgi:hypothetical protein
MSIRKRWIWVLWFGLILTGCVPKAQVAPKAVPVAIPKMDRLSAPKMPALPVQADYGANVYYQVCMACHGDRGQGLTNEWRSAWGEDSNCWTSKCHGPKHPPQGFEFPQVTSPVVGDGTLVRFDNAQQLHDYVVQTMPWWSPGSLKSDQYWQVTAFLMRSRGALPDGVTLGSGNALAFPVHPNQPLRGNNRPEVLFIASILSASGLFLLIQNRMRS